MTNSHGQSRRYIYNSLGALTRFIGADGRDLLFQYNLRGEMQGIFDEQTAGLIYQRNQSGNLAKLQQNANLKNFWQFQKVSYSSAFANSTTDDYCVFGDGWDTGGDGGIEWGNWDNYFARFVESTSCYDPFGGMFGGGGSGGGGETCYQCHLRETNNCNSTYTTTLEITAGGLLAGTGGCVALGSLTALIGGLICEAFIAGGTVLANDAARRTRDNCLTNVNSQCSSICNH